MQLKGTSVITKVLLKVLDDCYDSLSLALRFCLEDVAKDMFFKELISESTMTSPNYDAVISEFKTGMKEKKDTPQLKKHCQLFLTCLSSQGGPAEVVAEDLAEQWKKEVQELNISLSFDVVIYVTTDETEHLESLDIHHHFNELLRQFRHELHRKLAKGEEKLSNIADFVQQLVSTEDLCDFKDLDEVLNKLDCFYNFIDCEIIVLFAKRFASPALLQKFENHSKEAKLFCRSYTIKVLQNCFDINCDAHQTNASISLNIAWGNVIIDKLYMLIEQFSVKKESHFVLKHIEVTESSVHIEYFTKDSSIEIQETISHAQEKVSFMWFIGIHEFTINGHTILQVDNEDNFTFELALLNAARTGHNEAVKFLFDLTDNTDHCNEEGTTSLMLASEGGYEPVVKSLLLAGANVNCQDNDGWTALMKASRNNHITIIHTLLEVGANPHLQISDGGNALMIASFNGHHQVVEQLLKENVDYNYQQKNGMNALIYASLNGHSKVVELLLNAHADPNIQGKDGWTALMMASSEDHIKVVELLLNKSIDPNVHNNNGWTALMLASSKGHSKVVELLLNKNIDPNVHKNDGSTALMLASSKGHTKVVELLLNKRADPNKANRKGVTALMIASCHGYSQIVELLLKEADPNIQNLDGKTALQFATQNGHLQVVELLLKQHANPNIQDAKAGYNVLHVAVLGSSKKSIKYDFLFTALVGTAEDYIKIVQLLISQSSIDIDAITGDGFTSLMFASMDGCTEVVELLLEAGANPNLQSKTSTMKGIMSDLPGYILLQPQVKSLLLPNDSLLKGWSMYGWTALMFASLNGRLDIVQILLQAKAITDLQTEAGDTALLLAATKGHSDIVQQLLECGANPNKSNTGGMSPVYVAIYYLSLQHIRKLTNDPVISMECEKVDPGSCEDYVKIIRLLIAQPNINILVNTSCRGYISLHIASICGCIDAVELLLKVSVDLNTQTRKFETQNNLSYFPSNILLQPEFKTFLLLSDFQATSGFTALMFASANGHSEIVQLLLNAKANCDLQNENGETALHLAAARGYPDIVQLLLEYGAVPNISNRQGVTAIDAALSVITMTKEKITSMKAVSTLITMPGTYKHHLESMKLLIAQPNININEPIDGFTILMKASSFGNAQIVELILQAGADPNMSVSTPIDKSILATDRSRTLFSNESSLVGHEKNGWTALMLACENGHLEVVQLLLKAYANPNHQQEGTGITALIIAVEKGFIYIVQQLLEYGANPNIGDRSGFIAIHYAVRPNDSQSNPSNRDEDFSRSSKKLEIIQLLIERGVNINIQNMAGITPLMMACMDSCSNSIQVVELLLKSEADPNIQTSGTEMIGLTALMLACSHGNSKVAERLLKFNANPQLVDNNGFTATIHALCSGNKGLAYELVNDRDFSQNELNCLLIMDLLEGNQAEAISRLDDITDLTTDKKELLMSCVVGSLEDVVGKLHESGLHPDTPLVGGLTLLMIASSCGHIELVQYLVIIEADLNQRDIFWKYTPLFYAILGSKSNESVELLLKNGADINAVAGNQTPLDMANSSPVKHLMSSLLVRHGGQMFSELTSEKGKIVDMQSPIKKSPNFAEFSDQVKSLIQDTVVKGEQTEYTHI